MGGDNSVNRDAQRAQAAEERRRTEIWTQAQQPSEAEVRFNDQAREWNEWIQGRNYAEPPPSSFLNFDLYMPAQQEQIRARMADIQGVGAANLGRGEGKNVAGEIVREQLANEAAQSQAASYENAVAAQDMYYKTGALPWAQMQQSRNFNLLGNTSQMAQHYGDLRAQTRSRGLGGMILGGALGIGSAALQRW